MGDISIRQVVEKLRMIEQEAAKEKGEFRFFALFLREDSLDKWDLLVSSPWIDANQRKSMEYLAKLLQTRLDTQELLSISRIVLLPENRPGMRDIIQSLSSQHSNIELEDCIFSGIKIKRAYFITSQFLTPDGKSVLNHQDAMPA